jgi:hypothetical protein
MFHHLPPSILDELLRLLRGETREVAPPVAHITGPISLGAGTALHVASEGLEDLRERLADALRGRLVPQDQAPWRAHVTIQNKVPADDARMLLAQLKSGPWPRPLAITGLAAFYYRGGPWEPIARCAFSRSGRSRRS